MSDPQDYTVGWICTTATEYIAARLFLDEEHRLPDHVSADDKNDYTLGKMYGHNVVIAVRPDGEYGLGSAASVAETMLNSFPDIRVGLMVGIGGGAPSAKHDIRLGDVVVSSLDNPTGGLYQYDPLSVIKDRGLQPTGFFNKPPVVVCTALSALRSKHEVAGHCIEDKINAILEKNPSLRKWYGRPSQETDCLFKSNVLHPIGRQGSCRELCGQYDNLVQRPMRDEDEDDPTIHYGIIASSMQKIKDAAMRDTMATENGVMCLETGAADYMSGSPYLVVRGIGDYSDSHKYKEWHGYASMTAAAYAKELLGRMMPSRVEMEQRINKVLESLVVPDPYAKVTGLQMQATTNPIYEWLSAPDPSTNHYRALAQHHDGTNLWFIHEDAFKRWKKQANSFLWLRGMPGCGKTVLSSTVIEHLKQEKTCQPLLYFYFDFNDRDKQSLNDLLRSLIQQLYQGPSDSRLILEELWVSHLQSDRHPSTSSLQNVLKAMLNGIGGGVSIVLDALDESNHKKELLNWLKTLVESKHKLCRILVTSRSEEHIDSAFESWTRAENRIWIEQNDAHEDVLAYIKHRVCNEASFDRWQSRPDVQDEIVARVSEKADGSFRWAACQIEALRDCLDLERLRSALAAPLETVDRRITRILDNIPIGGEAGSVRSRSSSGDRTQSAQESRPTDLSVSDTAPSSFEVDIRVRKERSLEIPTYKVAAGRNLPEDDAESVTSLDDDIRSLAESDTPYALQKIASEHLIDALSEDTEISAAYNQSCTGQQAIEHERFVRNHVKLLKAFFLDVGHETHDVLSKEAARFLRSHNRRYQISAMIYQRTASTTTLELDEEAHKGDMYKVEDYLSKLVSDEAETGDSDFNSDLQIENDEADYPDSASDFSSEDDEAEYPKFEATVSFLTSSRAFVAYKARLRRFAGRLPQPEVAFQKALDDGILDDATAFLEHEGPAILNCKEYQYLRRLLDSGFDAREVVAHVLESRSWAAADDDWRNLWVQVRARLLTHADSISKLTGHTSHTKEAGYLNLKFADLRFRFSNSRLGRKIARTLRPAIPKGYTRVEWTCVCGKMLFDDYLCDTSSSLQTIQDMLASMSATPTGTTSNVGVSTANQVPGTHRVEQNSSNSSGNAALSSIPVPSDINPRLSAENPNLSGNLNNNSSSHQRLYICAKSGDLTLSVREIDTSSMRSDFQLFARIREEYGAIRRCVKDDSFVNHRILGRIVGWLHSIQLMRPSKAFFVQFQRLDHSPKYGTLVEVIENPSIPPSPPNEHGYCYAPDPLERRMPMSTNYFIHYLREPQEKHKEFYRWGPRFPKKTGESLLSSSKALPEGWGIELEEEWNPWLISVLCLVYIMTAALLMILWAILAKDKSSFATYVGNFIALTAIPWTVLLGMVYKA